MNEKYGDIWVLARRDRADAIVVTTNGYVNKKGEAVMGKGIAREAAIIYPELPKRLGNIIKNYGNYVWLHEFDLWNGENDYQEYVFTFPVKPEFGPNGEMGWKTKAQLPLIKESTKQLVSIIDELGFMNKIYMPRPGCGAGGLKWETVKPTIEPLLDERFTVITWHP